MQITIDNLDGRGAVSYTDAVVPEGPLTVTRVLNEPSTCTVELAAEAVGLPVPVRRARVVVIADDTSLLFTGYLPVEPTRIYVGRASTGSAYKVRLTAVSDEWLLDKLGPGAATSGLAQDAGELVRQLTGRLKDGRSVFAVETAGALRTLGAVSSKADAAWSVNTKSAASAGYAGYRVLDGQIALQSAPVSTHSLDEGDAVLDPGRLSLRTVRELTNDVTISGDEEPAAYVTEIFEGDGATSLFLLNDSAFRFAQQTVLRDGFEDALLDPARWNVSDPGGHMALGGGGFTFNGGSGADGQTMLTAISAIEVGGTVIAELSGVMLQAGSDGVLAGFYAGQPVLENCFVGFRVRQDVSTSGSQTVLTGVVNGTETGSTLALSEERSYTLRVRLHNAEVYRLAQRYYCMADGVVQGFGGAAAGAAPMHVVLEVVDESLSSNTPATVLFDSAASGTGILGAPALCQMVVVNAIQMFGSVRGVRVDQPGSVWVVSTLPSGNKVTRLTGSAGGGVDCEVRYGSQAGSPGSVAFLSGRVPAAGEQVTVFYRGQRRAVARLADAASVASEAIGSEAGTSRWLGKVLEPAARTSADCESAAQAVLAMATSRQQPRRAAMSG